MLAAKYLGTVTALVATAVIARFATPAEVGVVATALSIMAIARCLEEFGLGDAVVQRAELETGQVTVLFWINAAMGLALGAVFATAAAPIAGFFGQTELVPIIVALSLTFPFGALGGMHRALLRRSFRFRSLAAANAIATIAGSAAGIAIAVAGGGAWALVGQTLVNSLTHLVGCWVASGWRPGLPQRGTEVRPMLRFGIHLAAANFLGQATRNIDNILIAKFVGPAAVGVYDRAFQLMLLPMSHFNQPFNTAVVPALSRLQHDPEAYRRLYRKLNGVLASISFPIAVFLGVAAPAIVATLYGPAWSESATLLRLLAPCGLLLSLNGSIGWAFTSLGRTGRQVRWTVIASAVSIAGIVAGLPWGAAGVAVGLSAARILLRIPSLIYCYRGTFLRLDDLWRVTWPPVLASTMGGVLAFLVDPVEAPAAMRLAIQLAVFLPAYAIALRWLPGGRDRFAGFRTELAGWRRPRTPGPLDR